MEAEEAIYTDAADPLVNLTEADLLRWLNDLGCAEAHVRAVPQESDVHIGARVLERWFDLALRAGRQSYASRLLSVLAGEELEQVRQAFYKQLLDKTVRWSAVTTFIVARKP